MGNCGNMGSVMTSGYYECTKCKIIYVVINSIMYMCNTSVAEMYANSSNNLKSTVYVQELCPSCQRNESEKIINGITEYSMS